MEKLSEGKEEIYKTKLLYNDQEFELDLDSDYNSYIEKICNLLDISPDSLYLFSMNYNDDDGDNILLSSNEDYKLFFQQVKEKTVNELIIERKDSINDLNKEINNESESNIDINSSNNINNNNINPLNNKDINNKKNEEDIPIEDITFYYRCSSCDIYPIVIVMYYCDKCNIYLCEKCEKNKKKHQHPFIKIENKAQLIYIKEEENKKIEEDRKAKEKEENNKNYLYNNRENYIRSHLTQNQNYLHNNYNPPAIIYPSNNFNRIIYPSNYYHNTNNLLYDRNSFNSLNYNYNNNLNLNGYQSDISYNRNRNNNFYDNPVRRNENYNNNYHLNFNYNRFSL